jgi:hypothetical protein
MLVVCLKNPWPVSFFSQKKLIIKNQQALPHKKLYQPPTWRRQQNWQQIRQSSGLYFIETCPQLIDNSRAPLPN